MAKFEKNPDVDVQKAFDDALEQNGIKVKQVKAGKKPPKYVFIKDDEQGVIYKIPTNSAKKSKKVKIVKNKKIKK